MSTDRRSTGGFRAPGTKERVWAWGIVTEITTTALQNSFNISSITDNGTGDTTFTLINGCRGTQPVIVCSGRPNTDTNQNYGISAAVAPTATAFRVLTGGGSGDGIAADALRKSIIIYSDHQF